MHNTRRELGKRLKEFRKLRGITQEALGETASLSYKFIGELERGRVNVSLDSLVKIAEALGISIADLFEQGVPTVITVTEKNALTRLSKENLLTIRKALKLLNKTFQ